MFSIPVIDVEATSQKLKNLREKRNIKVSEIQKSLNMTYPQAIYNWENPDLKDLPNIDHLVFLAKLYSVSIDELIVIRKEESTTLAVNEPIPSYEISQEILYFISSKASHDTKLALEKYYGFSISFLQ
ncbi:MAG: helix-turn-helix transcriptional regulator [Treponemataceae bacterium]|nr:helix-turn-helix transcriptional regulator [Spirochaetales bacterium]MDY6030287.1 helix-turn-helix transcriptional regulator [Treponemataceae bacterium]